MCKDCLTGAWYVRNTYSSTSELQWKIFLCQGDKSILEPESPGSVTVQASRLQLFGCRAAGDCRKAG